MKKRIVLPLLALALLLSLGVLAAPAEDKAKDRPLSDELKPFVEKGTLAGAVLLVADKDKVLTLEAVGHADVAAKKEMRTDSLFWIASMSKPITAVALMMLVDEGKVKLDDPVEKYLPEFAEQAVVAARGEDLVVLRKAKQPILVRHLLTHTSGMPFASRLERPTLDRLTLREATLSYAMTPLQTEPGTKHSYSNAGINTAGRIIEVVSKMPYEKFLQERLFDPLGMKDTTFWPDEKQVARLAKSYRPNKAKDGLEETKIGQLIYPLSDRKRQPMPAGGLFSTASDLSNFCRMMLEGGTFGGKEYLSKEAVKEMTRDQTGGLTPSWGLGWAAGKKEGEPYGHGGAHGTNMSVDPKKGLVLIYLIQHTGGFPGKDGGKIRPTFEEAARRKYAK
jgi:CubicO group peptidase (beta-lactamase class C family)